MPQIKVEFDIDANGILNVSAKDNAAGEEQRITISASTKLSKEDVAKMVQEAQKNASDDRRRAEAVQARNEAGMVIYQAEKSLKDLGDKVAFADRQRVETKIAELKSAMNSGDTAQIRRIVGELQQATMAIGQNMYQTPESGGSTQPGRDRPEDEDIVEGEFRQV
jgi:molecular chaperone DnaK